jgi:hypothetical protein
MTIYHAVIHTMTEAGTIPHGFLTVENGKITCVQSGDPDTVTEDDLDAKGSLLLPGFIDAHTHLGILEDGLDFEGDDCNECPSLLSLRDISLHCGESPRRAEPARPQSPAAELYFCYNAKYSCPLQTFPSTITNHGSHCKSNGFP